MATQAQSWGLSPASLHLLQTATADFKSAGDKLTKINSRISSGNLAFVSGAMSSADQYWKVLYVYLKYYVSVDICIRNQVVSQRAFAESESDFWFPKMKVETLPNGFDVWLFFLRKTYNSMIFFSTFMESKSCYNIFTFLSTSSMKTCKFRQKVWV